MKKRYWFPKKNRYHSKRTRFMNWLVYWGSMAGQMIGILIALASMTALVITADAIMNH